MALTKIKNLKALRVEDSQEHKRERLIIRVEGKCQLAHYLVLDATYDVDKKVSNKNRHAFRFPNQEVEEGDEVILYTASEEDAIVKPNLGNRKTKTHIFFWNLDSSVWNNSGDVCSIFEISKFQHTGIRKSK